MKLPAQAFSYKKISILITEKTAKTKNFKYSNGTPENAKSDGEILRMKNLIPSVGNKENNNGEDFPKEKGSNSRHNFICVNGRNGILI